MSPFIVLREYVRIFFTESGWYLHWCKLQSFQAFHLWNITQRHREESRPYVRLTRSRFVFQDVRCCPIESSLFAAFHLLVIVFLIFVYVSVFGLSRGSSTYFDLSRASVRLPNFCLLGKTGIGSLGGKTFVGIVGIVGNWRFVIWTIVSLSDLIFFIFG